MNRYRLLVVLLGVGTFAATLAIQVRTRGLLQADSQPAAAAGLPGAPPLPIYTASAALPSAATHEADNSQSQVQAQPAVAPAAAYSQLRSPPSSEVSSLQAIVEADTNVRSRIKAVNALRTIGMSGDDDGSIRAALRTAMQDSNPNVKQNAEQAYELIAMKYDSAEQP